MASTDLTLYFTPGSSCSAKVRYALFEKGLSYNERQVNVSVSEQNQGWYLRMNPKGLVPILQDGETVVCDPDVIIDYLDKHFSSGPCLAPEVDTPLGQQVQEYRKLFYDVNIHYVTYGTLANRKFCVTKMRYSQAFQDNNTRESIKLTYENSIETLKESRRNSPELKDDIDVKIETIQQRKSNVLDEDKIGTVLNELEQVFDKVGQRLQTSIKVSGGSDSVWLLGKDFTAADISATILMYRLYNLGIDERYFSAKTRPVVFDYYKRLIERPGAKKVL